MERSVRRLVLRSQVEAHSCRAGTNNPAPGVYVCADGDPPGDHRLAYSWLPVLATESILLGLSLFRRWQHRRLGYGHSTILHILTRDSVIYFLVYVDERSLFLNLSSTRSRT